MADELIPIGPGFWNLRGTFRVAGVVNVGTQMSLAQLSTGGFVLLDSYRGDEAAHRKVLELTDGGRAVSAILNLHPFHTASVERIAETFRDARLYGTRRHTQKFPHLRWEKCATEDPGLTDFFGGDFTFSTPRGVDFIPSNEHLHFASVLALHRQSKTLHVDDTLTWISLPLVGGLRFHPSLAEVLQRRPGAVAEFRSWTEELLELCNDVDHLCTAHMKPLPRFQGPGESVRARVSAARTAIEKTLTAHQKRYG